MAVRMAMVIAVSTHFSSPLTRYSHFFSKIFALPITTSTNEKFRFPCLNHWAGGGGGDVL